MERENTKPPRLASIKKIILFSFLHATKGTKKDTKKGSKVRK